MTDISTAYQIYDEKEEVFQRMAAKEITSLIQKMPLGYKLVFNMFVIEGYSHKEIAKILDTSESNSKSQLFKARKWLKVRVESQLKMSRYE